MELSPAAFYRINIASAKCLYEKFINGLHHAFIQNLVEFVFNSKTNKKKKKMQERARANFPCNIFREGPITKSAERLKCTIKTINKNGFLFNISIFIYYTSEK